jgi:hypothetical protein
MNLDDAQKKTVASWIAEGQKLSDIQKRLITEFGLNLTYMEVRFLVDDLKLVPKDPPSPPKSEKPIALPAPDTGPQTPAGGESPPLEPALDEVSAATGPGKVSVHVDTVARPGTLVSGTVTFSDGQGGIWYLDQMGRLGIGPKQQGYKPSAADLQTFQQMLETELSKIGF